MTHTPGGSAFDRMLSLGTSSSATRGCGCELFRSGHDGKSVTFRYCDTHAAAPALLKALEGLMPLAQRFFQDYAPDAATDFTCGHHIRQARAAIALAKGETIG